MSMTGRENVFFGISAQTDKITLMAEAKRTPTDAAVIYFLLYTELLGEDKPSREEIITALGSSPASIQRSLKRLTDAGILIRQRGYEIEKTALDSKKANPAKAKALRK